MQRDWSYCICFTTLISRSSTAQPAKQDLNKKSFSKQKTIQNFTIDTQGFRKTKNENPPTWETGVPADLPMVGRLAGNG